MYEKAEGRNWRKEKKEMAVLAAYMPEQLPEEKIRELAKLAVEQPEPKEKKRLGK